MTTHQPPTRDDARLPNVLNLCERTTWAEVLSGDIVIIENLPMQVWRMSDLFTVRPVARRDDPDTDPTQEWAAPVRIDQSLPVIRLKRAPESVAFAVLKFCGLGPVVIE